jgi:hypothetical protein
MSRISWRRFWIFLASAMLLALLWAGGIGYRQYWLRGAFHAVRTAASEIASGESPPNVRFAELVDREALSAAFATSYVGEAFDAISLDLRDYAITIRVENGDLYEFEASHTGTDWQLACCERPNASDLP